MTEERAARIRKLWDRYRRFWPLNKPMMVVDDRLPDDPASDKPPEDFYTAPPTVTFQAKRVYTLVEAYPFAEITCEGLFLELVPLR